MATHEERNARLAGVLDTQFSENPYGDNAFSLSEACPGTEAEVEVEKTPRNAVELRDENAPLPETPKRKKETKKAQESEAGGSAAVAKTRDHGVGSFWKTLWAALAAIATIMLLLFMQSLNTTLAAWGRNADGQTNVPAGKDFVAIAAGCHYSLALRKDGSLAAWGDNIEDDQTDVSSGTNFVAIAAGGWHSVALRGEYNTAEEPLVSKGEPRFSTYIQK